MYTLFHWGLWQQDPLVQEESRGTTAVFLPHWKPWETSGKAQQRETLCYSGSQLVNIVFFLFQSTLLSFAPQKWFLPRIHLWHRSWQPFLRISLSFLTDVDIISTWVTPIVVSPIWTTFLSFNSEFPMYFWPFSCKNSYQRLGVYSNLEDSDAFMMWLQSQVFNHTQR